MRSRAEQPTTAICPRTGSRVFIGDDLLDLTEPVSFICPICEHRHVWNPATFTLTEPDLPLPATTAKI